MVRYIQPCIQDLTEAMITSIPFDWNLPGWWLLLLLLLLLLQLSGLTLCCWAQGCLNHTTAKASGNHGDADLQQSQLLSLCK